MVKMTRTSLADQRELIYFDHDGSPARAMVDPRSLPTVSSSSQLRWDPLLEEWVMMASHRQSRTFLPPANECPLCPSREGHQSEVPADDYDVVVFENRFPSLSTHADAGALESNNPLIPIRPGFGRCEVVCFSSNHDASFADLTVQDAGLVIEAWAQRTTELSQLDGVEQVFCFESRGREIGVTLSHPHGQIYAYPFLTPRTERMRAAVRRHRERTGEDLHATLLKAELEAQVRVISETPHWVAFVPGAARWPVEVHVYPRRRVRTLAELDAAERADLAGVYLDLLRRFDHLYDAPLPYIAAWHQGGVKDPEELDYLHLQLFSIRRTADKLKYLAGSESGMGAFVTDALPEAIAQRLRDA
nr:galactose-1-phosphate uridylyltransferase [Ornithinimicrobium sp. HY1745]